MSDSLQPDREEIHKFLCSWFADAPGRIVASGMSRPSRGTERFVDHIGSGDIEKVTEVMAQWPYDAYVRMTTTRSTGKTRGKADDALALPGGWADIDGVWGKHKNKEGLARHPDEVREWASNIEFPPNLLVSSGGGFYGFWRVPVWELQTPDEVQAAKAFMTDWQEYLRRTAPFKIDSTQDLARVLRVPGTINFKAEPKLVTVTDWNQNLYTVEQLRSAALPVHSFAVSIPGSPVASHSGPVAVTSTKPSRLPPWLNDEMTKPVNRGQRSEAFFALVARCKRDGFTVEHAAWLLAQFPWAREKYGDRLCSEVSRAWDKVPDADEQSDVSWSVPLHIDPPPPPPMPIESFPDELRAVICAVAEYTGTPVDFAALAALGGVSAVATGRVSVRGSWTEPANLYLAAVGAPGARKTPVWQLLARPLRQIEQDLQERWRDGAAERSARLKLNERKRRNIINAADEADDAAVQELAELERTAVALDLPIPRVLLEDVTPEAMVSEWNRQDGRLTLWSDEGGAVFSQARGRYAKHDPFIEPFLKGYSCVEPLIVTRQGGRHIHIERPALTVCLAMQPAVLHSLRDDDPIVARGLLSRFLFAFPIIDFDHIDVAPRPEPTESLASFENLVVRVSAALAADPSPVSLILTVDAAVEHTSFREEVAHLTAARVKANGDTDPLLAALNKLAGQALRLAAVLHMAQHPDLRVTEREIPGTTMRRGVVLARYFLHQAERITPSRSGASALPVALTTLKVIVAKLVADLPSLDVWMFRQRDLMRAMTRFPTVADLEPVLRNLEQMGYIAPVPAASNGAKPGRPAIQWLVNPMIVRWARRHKDADLPVAWHREAIDDIAAHETEVGALRQSDAALDGTDDQAHGPGQPEFAKEREGQ